MWTSTGLSLVLVALFSNSRVEADCHTDKLAVYRVTFSTYWDRDRFPRQYPEWRPPAQWSKLVGFSHNSNYQLFRLGETSSVAVKQFVETGETTELEANNPGLKKAEDILDNFVAPPIDKGVGRSNTKIFVDGNHTKISLMSKLVPSPDWFVGLDSLELCENGHFMDTITVEADPMDAGTDNGFTFTSPNWPTLPAGVIFRITNTYPTHPAGSFYYPDISSLPTIASFSLVKEKEFELSEVYHMDTESESGTIDIEEVNKYSYEVENKDVDNTSIVTFVAKEHDDVHDDDLEDEFEDDYEDDDDYEDEDYDYDEEDDEGDYEETNEILPNRRKHNHGLTSTTKTFRNENSGYHASTGPTDFLRKKYRSKLLRKAQDKIFNRSGHLYEKLMASYRAKKKAGLSDALAKKLRKRRLRRLRRLSKKRQPRDCKVSEWSDWGPCSKSCGIGEAQRSRTVVREAKRGGKPCPKLVSVKWCGSARNCRENYFNW